jgi:D-psicose/D-tagatose/L-ribulose 3-epimerase
MPQIPNLLGVHALVWVGGWTYEETVEAIRNSAEAGYGLIEIPALDPSTIDVEHTKKVLKDFGMKGACSLGLTFDADINSEDMESVARGEARLMDALSVVEGIGGDYLGGVIYSALGKYTLPTTPKAKENAVNVLRKLAKEAGKRGITIGLEPVNRYESNLINTGEQALEIIEMIGEPNVVVHLDVYHMNIEEQDMVSPVFAVKEKLGYVHIGASHRGALGTGNIDFPAFFGVLAQVGYTGTITFESFSSAVVHPDLSSTLAIWRNLWIDNKSMARSAHDFMHQHIVDAHKNS